MNRKNPERIGKLVEEVLLMEAQEAKEAGALGFMARAMVQATLPHSKPKESIFERRNGAYSMVIMAHPNVGLPYGTIPRLLLAWMTTEAVRTKDPVLVLGPALSDFMNSIGMVKKTGGRWGSITRLREQMKRLFSSTISYTYEELHRDSGANFNVADSYDLWWDPKSPEQAALWKSTVTLGHRLFEEVINGPVPIDLRALDILKGSPMALDIYIWLTYRMSYMSKRTEIPWKALELQFGSEYKETRVFKHRFLQHLKAVQSVYTEAKVVEGSYGLILSPSKPHVPRSVVKRWIPQNQNN